MCGGVAGVSMQSIQNNKILESNCRITRVYSNVPGGSGSDLWLRHKKKGGGGVGMRVGV